MARYNQLAELEDKVQKLREFLEMSVKVYSDRHDVELYKIKWETYNEVLDLVKAIQGDELTSWK